MSTMPCWEWPGLLRRVEDSIAETYLRYSLNKRLSYLRNYLVTTISSLESTGGEGLTGSVFVPALAVACA